MKQKNLMNWRQHNFRKHLKNKISTVELRGSIVEKGWVDGKMDGAQYTIPKKKTCYKLQET